MIETFNKFDYSIREAVDKAMQEYLYRHNGYIDSWPVLKTELGFELKSKSGKSMKYEFDYFGSDVSVKKVETKDCSITTFIGRDHHLVYRSGCILQDLDEYVQMNEKLKTTPELQFSAECRKLQQEIEEYHHQQQQFSDVWHREWFDICDSIAFGFEEPMKEMPW